MFVPMTSAPPPKAFISHASEDKKRFVTAFAKRLRENGIEAWLDEWEIQPGDSLVDKIFEHGIKNADVFIVILSHNSVEKPWVKEELDSGIVQKINNSCRIIPILLDDCDVPASLTHLKWLPIPDTENFDSELKIILNVIFGASEKPPLGPSPPLATKKVINYYLSLTKTDNLVFEVLGNSYLETGNIVINIEEKAEKFSQLGLTDEEILESLEMLENRYLIEPIKTHDPEIGKWRIIRAKIEWSALTDFARKILPDYDQLVVDIISAIVNKELRESEEILASVPAPPRVVEIIIRDLESLGLLHVVFQSNGRFHCIEPKSPELKRMLQ